MNQDFRGSDPKLALSKFVGEFNDQQFDTFVADSEIQGFFVANGLDVPVDKVEFRMVMEELSEAQREALLALIK